MKVEMIKHSVGGQTYDGALIYDEAVKEPRPAVLMAPNWMGLNPGAIERGHVRQTQIEIGNFGKQPLLAAEISDHHRGIDSGRGGDVANHRPFIALFGKKPPRRRFDRRARPFRLLHFQRLVCHVR